jgi:aryl-alcohol dehydrogenase-like predicted oxidoreductase
MATSEGTWAYRDRFGDRFGRTYFRRFGPRVASSVGLGTYLGDPTDAVDDDYREAVRFALEHGVNVIDTAVNYRCGRSERVVGEALAEADVDREAVHVATKGGFVPFEGERPANPGEYVRETFVDSGLVDPADLARGSHCIAPAFLDAMVDRSLAALDLDRIDLYYLHNPETQLTARSREAVYDAIEAAFVTLERRVAAGDIGAYGVATWEAFRVPPDADAYLSLRAVHERARRAAARVGADDPALAAVQLPFNVVMADAFSVAAHPHPDAAAASDADPGPTGGAERDPSGVGGARAADGPGEEAVSALEYLQASSLHGVASASLAQGRLAAELPAAVRAELAGDTTAQRAINFARSAPGVATALVGTSDRDHLAENVAAGTFDPLGARAFDAVFE